MSTTTLPHGGAAASISTTSPSRQVRVWDLPTRVFHWSLALSFAGAWLTADSERLRDLHVMLGYTLAGLIAFRLVWGVVGTTYARFSSFIFSPAQTLDYLKTLLTSRPQHLLGHNPAGAVAIFFLLGLGFLSALSGYLTLHEIGGEWAEELHEGAANAMLAVVVIHLLGVLVSSLLHRENLVWAMVTGHKLAAGEAAEKQGIGGTRRLLGALLLIATVGFWGAWQAGWVPDSGAAGVQSSADHDDD
jgi:cytochrome b